MMNYRTREGIKHLVIAVALSLVAVWILKINEIMFLIMGTVAFGIFIRGMVHFIQRIRVKNRIRKNRKDNDADKIDTAVDKPSNNSSEHDFPNMTESQAISKDALSKTTRTHKDHKYNENFAKIKSNYSSDGLERIIELEYDKERIINTKIFLSEKQREEVIYTRGYKEKIERNRIHLKINLNWNRSSARLISGGNFDFNDSTDNGYTIFVSMRFFEKPLFNQLISILRDNKFGCLSSNYTIHAHKDARYPTEHEAKKILKHVTDDISDKLTKHGVKQDSSTAI